MLGVGEPRHSESDVHFESQNDGNWFIAMRLTALELRVRLTGVGRSLFLEKHS